MKKTRTYTFDDKEIKEAIRQYANSPDRLELVHVPEGHPVDIVWSPLLDSGEVKFKAYIKFDDTPEETAQDG